MPTATNKRRENQNAEYERGFKSPDLYTVLTLMDSLVSPYGPGNESAVLHVMEELDVITKKSAYFYIFYVIFVDFTRL